MITTDKQAYMKSLQDRLEIWQEKIASLRAEAETVDQRAKAEYVRQVDLLTAKSGILREKFQVLRQEKDATWEEAKVIAEKALHEMQDAFDSALAKLK